MTKLEKEQMDRFISVLKTKMEPQFDKILNEYLEQEFVQAVGEVCFESTENIPMRAICCAAKEVIDKLIQENRIPYDF